MTKLPTVSVLTAVYNGEARLAQAIESVLGQSRTDFEYLIIDDGSQDGSHALAAAYAMQDDRIVLLRNESNLGISRTLNRGFAAAQGDVVMVLDHDDVAHPERLAQQSALLAAQPDVGVVGCFLEVVDLQGRSAGCYCPPTTPLRLRWELLFRNAIPMGAGAFRRELLGRCGGLSTSFGISADYELLARLGAVTQMVLVPQVLLSYRQHRGQITRLKSDRTHWEAMVAAASWWHHSLGFKVNLGQVGLVYRGVNGWNLADDTEAAQAAALIGELQQRFLQRERPGAADRAYLQANVEAKLAALQAAVIE